MQLEQANREAETQRPLPAPTGLGFWDSVTLFTSRLGGLQAGQGAALKGAELGVPATRENGTEWKTKSNRE